MLAPHPTSSARRTAIAAGKLTGGASGDRRVYGSVMRSHKNDKSRLIHRCAARGERREHICRNGSHCFVFAFSPPETANCGLFWDESKFRESHRKFANARAPRSNFDICRVGS